MFRFIALPLAALAACAPLSPQAQAGPAAQGALPAEVRERLDQLKACADARAAARKFSGVIMVAFDGRRVLSEAYGMADPETGRTVTLSSRFDTGSAPKMFAAVALGQLVQAGAVTFDDPVGKYVEGLPPEVAAVTLHQLLTHTSGLGSYFSPDNVEVIVSATTAAELVPAAAATGLAFRPGAEWKYSNAGFVLVGAVVERVSGKRYADYVADRILAPAGMTQTTLDGIPEGAAAGLSRQGARDPNADPDAVVTPWTGRFSPAGGAFSTAEDMLKFLDALRTGKLLDQATLEMLWTEHIAGPRSPPRENHTSAYGYGFGVRTFGDTRVVGHNGGLPGYNTEVSLAPEAGWSVAVLSNFDPPAGNLLSGAARDIMSGLQPLPGVCEGEDPPSP